MPVKIPIEVLKGQDTFFWVVVVVVELCSCNLQNIWLSPGEIDLGWVGEVGGEIVLWENASIFTEVQDSKACFSTPFALM